MEFAFFKLWSSLAHWLQIQIDNHKNYFQFSLSLIIPNTNTKLGISQTSFDSFLCCLAATPTPLTPLQVVGQQGLMLVQSGGGMKEKQKKRKMRRLIPTILICTSMAHNCLPCSVIRLKPISWTGTKVWISHHSAGSRNYHIRWAGLEMVFFLCGREEEVGKVRDRRRRKGKGGEILGDQNEMDE